MPSKAAHEDYEAFVEKFEPKKTTDDCITPPGVYEAVLAWCVREYGVDPERVVRPFWPGGDYEAAEYPDGCAVVDNPPFSILARICGFYLDRGVPFFLFAPALTLLSSAKTVMRMNHLACGCSVVYENGADVKTSFVTNMGDPDVIVQSAPELTRSVNEAADRKSKAKSLPKYAYPDEVLTAAMAQRYSLHGVEFEVRRGECRRISALDGQRAVGKTIFGGGLLLSERAAAERAAAHVWGLSGRERKLSSELGVRPW